MKSINKPIALLAIGIITAPALGDQVWTWTGDASNPNWTNSVNWSCDGTECPNPLTFPNNQGADVIIPDTSNDPVVNDVLLGPDFYELRTLTLNSNALLTIPLGTCAGNGACMGLQVFAKDGLNLSAGSKVSIEGGFLELLGGGKLNIDPAATIEFANTGNGRLVFSRGPVPYRAPLYEIPGGSGTEVIRASVLGIIEGHTQGTQSDSIGSGGAPTLVLWDREITGLLMIYVRLINNGRVVADESNHWITLDCQPKGGSGRWEISHQNAKIIANVPVTGTDQSVIQLNYGVLSLADIWATTGRFFWLGGSVTADPGAGLIVGEAVPCSQ